MLKKTLLAASLALASLAATASNFYLVVPVKGRTVSVDAISVALSGNALPAGQVGTPYVGFDLKSLLTVTGDAAYNGYGVKWAIVSGALPAGLALSPAGVLSGTPTANGTASFQARATYKTKSGEHAYQVVVSAVSILLAESPAPDAVVGVAYNFDLKPKLTVTGDPAYNGSGVTWSVVSSTLPAGLQLNAAGVITGTPTVEGAGTLTARAAYLDGRGEQTYQLVTLNLTVTMDPVTLPDAYVDTPYPAVDFKPLLKVTGDPQFDATKATFRGRALPFGMQVVNGVLSGSPSDLSAEAGHTLRVEATYKGKMGQASYNLKIGTVAFDAVELTAGAYHNCAVTRDGAAKCWGQNSYSQLGSNGGLYPKTVIGLSGGVASIKAGEWFSCALTSGGAVKCWGSGSAGQLGDGTSGTNKLVPVDVIGLGSGVASISTGKASACAVLTTGGVKCWGAGTSYQLGNGAAVNSATPVNVVGLPAGIAAVAVGASHACARTTAGALYCWGNNSYGQQGNGSASGQVTTPTLVPGMSSGVTAVAIHTYHSCAAVAGAVKCWGTNSSGQLGTGTTASALSPATVTGLSNATALSVGPETSCAITATGGVKCWGKNTSGAVGNGTTVNASAPVDVFGISSGVARIAVGNEHSCALFSSGAAKCWGYNSAGTLGDRTTTSSTTPVSVR